VTAFFLKLSPFVPVGQSILS